MRVAVTGSHGFIGTALRASLLDDGHEPVAIGRDSITSAALRGSDAVVHLAGEPIGAKRLTAEQKRRILESRTTTTSAVARAMVALGAEGPQVLVSASAIGYYGDRGDEVLTETSAPGDDFLAGVCTAWEAAADPARDAGLRVAHVRTGLVLGRGGALAKMLPLFRVGLGGRFGSGRQWWSWISLDDEVGAIRFLLDHDVAGPVNLTGPAPLTNAAFTKVLARVLHRPAVVPVPKFGPRLLLGRELADELLFTSQRVEPAVLAAHGYRFRHPDAESALRATLG